MFSRRRFLQGTGATAALLHLPRLAAAGPQPQSGSALPPSIAALTPMRGACATRLPGRRRGASRKILRAAARVDSAAGVHEGTILLIDGGCTVEGYASDISRTFVLGTPTDKMKKVFEIERRAQDAALAAAKPGVPCEAVDAAARRVIVDAGYGPGYTYFTHRVGHGMGMDGHEWPYLTRGNTLPFAPQSESLEKPF